MGQLHIDLFTTLDLVAQAPGSPEEDPEGFPFGGWQTPLFDDVVGREVTAALDAMDALLLGRRTYDIFAAYWPQRDGAEDGVIANRLNTVPKYVVSRGKPDLDWAGSELLSTDVPSAVQQVRERHENVHVIGSIDFAQTLLRERLFDRLNLWVYPIVLGVGKKVFADGAVPANLTLAEPPVTSGVGAVLLRYALAEGEPGVGDMSQTVVDAEQD